MVVVSIPKEIRSSFYGANELGTILCLTVSVVSFCVPSLLFSSLFVLSAILWYFLGVLVRAYTIRLCTVSWPWNTGKRFLMCFSAHGHPQDRYFLNIANLLTYIWRKREAEKRSAAERYRSLRHRFWVVERLNRWMVETLKNNNFKRSNTFHRLALQTASWGIIQQQQRWFSSPP